MQIRYRLRQVGYALLAFFQVEDEALATRYLTPPLLVAFRQMTRGERQHSLRVLCAVLQQADDTPHDLVVAALMHDCGKARYPLTVFGKSLAVAVRHLLPRVYARRAAHDPARHPASIPFIEAEQHPTWSGDVLRAAGASDRAVWLVRHHADPLHRWDGHPHQPLLRRLKAADDAN